ncbi:Response regulator containing a CheY-like receiver domain and a GGDEF domain [Hahella chejuensis KCTC 2396]|uniref:diguanylate cyclase n=1 Tax=Hahella chejuensis (strain KCTC 2396) TaxID=349521 RepID=Q2SLU8_HAHCH|nr:diguanylate cyclase [Hahella chejuensis]ABC28376.1 Response regulator containing a CheY-like receiver domain and a GGDEF domain [Hahella chejuensis KCTC 2396]
MCGLFLLCAQVFASTYNSIQLTSRQERLEVAPYLWWVAENHGEIKIEDILERKTAPMGWRQNNRFDPNFGLDVSPRWFRFSVTNAGAESVERWLEISYPVLDDIRVYLTEEEKVVEAYHSGDTLNFRERPVFHRNFIFPFKFKPHSKSTVYIRIQTQGALELPADLWSPTAFVQADQWKLAAQFLFSGIMLAMAAYNLALGFVIRDLTFMHYVGYVVSIAIVQLALHGAPFQFIWPHSPQWNQISLVFFIGCSVTFASLFGYRFLNLNVRGGILPYIAISCAFFGLFCCALAFSASYATGIKIAVLATGVVSIVWLIIGLLQWSRREPTAAYFTLAWAVFLVGNIAISLEKIGLIPNLTIIGFMPQIGACIEVMIFSLALAQRINIERRRHISMRELALHRERSAREAEQSMLMAQQQANDELERRVAIRTEELNEAMKKLSVAHEQLNEIATFDQLTQLKNKASFERVLLQEWSRCSRSISALSLVFIDIDRFQKVNQQFGQFAGDTCLQVLAKLISSMTRRAGDSIFRYEGDCYVLVLAHCSAEGALQLSEQIRSRTEATLIHVDEARFSVTVSIGLSSDIPSQGWEPKDLMERAREALAEAKMNGGNGVSFRM